MLGHCHLHALLVYFSNLDGKMADEESERASKRLKLEQEILEAEARGEEAVAAGASTEGPASAPSDLYLDTASWFSPCELFWC